MGRSGPVSLYECPPKQEQTPLKIIMNNLETRQ